MTEVIPYTDAVDRIAAPLADRTAYLIVAPPDTVSDAISQLAAIPGWTAYIANGTPFTIVTNDPRAAAVLTALSAPLGVVAVFTVPKTTPAATLSKALSQLVPDDGSQDVIMLQTKANLYAWPLLFIDAMTKVDPRTAAMIRASSLPLNN